MPDEPQEPQVPTEPQEPQEPTEPIEPIEPIEPVEPTTQEIVDAALEKQSNQFQSWIGRREVEQEQKFKTMLDERVATPVEPEADVLEQDPTKWLNSELDKRDNATATFKQDVMHSAAEQMTQNPLYAQTKAGENKLGVEVVKNVMQMIAGMKPQPGAAPGAMAEMLVNRSLNMAMQKQGKANPLAGNTVAGEPLGTITPSNTIDPTKPKAPVFDEYTENYIKQTGISKEEVAKLFAD